MNRQQSGHSGELSISKGQSEHGVVVGNTYDKYSARNPIVRLIMRGFERALQGLVANCAPKSIHEVGCGEGYWTLLWAEQGFDVRGSDFSDMVVSMARSNASARGLNQNMFRCRSVYDLNPIEDCSDLLVCCEVLEHLEHPSEALEVLRAVGARRVILSVPREPLWSFMNMARGKYWSDFGNTPGHIQRWSQETFLSLVGQYFHIREVRAPLPWTMVLAEPREIM